MAVPTEPLIEFVDREHLSRWLGIQSREGYIAIASRSSLRVLPLIVPIVEKDQDLLLTLRASLLATIGVVYSDIEFRTACNIVYDKMENTSPYMSGDILERVKALASHFAFNCIAEALCVSMLDSIMRRGQARDDIGRGASSVAAYAILLSVRAQGYMPEAIDLGLSSDPCLAADAAELENGVLPKKLSSLPLWSDHMPQWANLEFERFRDAIERLGYFSFWLRWYQARVDGVAVDWNMLREIALIDEEYWEAGPARVSEKILEIEARYQSKPIDSTMYRDQIDRLLTNAALTDLTARTSADFLDAILANWRAECGNSPPDELMTLERVPPVLRRIALVVKAEAEDRSQSLKSELETLRQLVLQLRTDVAERETRIAEALAVNSDLARANAELAKQLVKSSARSTRMMLLAAFAGGFGEAAFGALGAVAPTLLGPLLDGSVLEFLAQRAPNAPVSAPPPPATLDI